MLSMAAAQWRVRARRSLALLSMIAVAVAGFTLLTAAAVTSRLDAVGTVTANYRPVYDILVRPKDSVLPLEQQRNLVQAGQLAGMRGGITTQQWHDIQAMGGVSVAAPVAVVGYVMRTVPITVDLAGDLDPALQRELLRVQPTWVTDAGLSRIPDGPAYLYSTRNRLYAAPADEWYGKLAPPLQEIDADGRRVAVCPGVPIAGREDVIDPTDRQGRSSLTCVDGPRSPDAFGNHMKPTVTLAWTVPFLMAAVDPAAEAQLAGLDKAVTSGRYFTPAETPVEHRLPGMPYPYSSLPIMIADRPQVDATLQLDVQRMDGGSIDLVRRPAANDRALRAELTKRPGTSIA